MKRRGFSRFAGALLLAVLAGGSWTSLAGAALRGDGHCSPGGGHIVAGASRHGPGAGGQRHQPSRPVVSAGETHGCGECPSGHCSTADHCAPAASAALPVVARPLDFASAGARAMRRVAHRPLSANPTPPIPPPQPVR